MSQKSEDKKRTGRAGKVLTGVAALALVGAVGTAVYYYGYRKPTRQEVVQDAVQKDPQALTKQTASEDTILDELVAMKTIGFNQLAGDASQTTILDEANDKIRIKKAVDFSVLNRVENPCRATVAGVSPGFPSVSNVIWNCPNAADRILFVGRFELAERWARLFNDLVKMKQDALIAANTTAPAAASAATPATPAAVGPFRREDFYW